MNYHAFHYDPPVRKHLQGVYIAYANAFETAERENAGREQRDYYISRFLENLQAQKQELLSKGIVRKKIC